MNQITNTKLSQYSSLFKYIQYFMYWTNHKPSMKSEFILYLFVNKIVQPIPYLETSYKNLLLPKEVSQQILQYALYYYGYLIPSSIKEDLYRYKIHKPLFIKHDNINSFIQSHYI